MGTPLEFLVFVMVKEMSVVKEACLFRILIPVGVMLCAAGGVKAALVLSPKYDSFSWSFRGSIAQVFLFGVSMATNISTLNSPVGGSVKNLDLGQIYLEMLEHNGMFSCTLVVLMINADHRTSVLDYLTPIVDGRRSYEDPGAIFILVSTFLWTNLSSFITLSSPFLRKPPCRDLLSCWT